MGRRVEVSQHGNVNDLVSGAMADSRWDDAREILKVALASMPPNWRPLQEDARCVKGAFWDQEEFSAYVSTHRAKTKRPIWWRGPSYSKMWWQLAIVYSEEGQAENAIAAIESGLAIEPEHPRLWVEKGFLLNRLTQHQAALESYETAVSIRDWAPNSLRARALRGLGSALIDLERLEDAQRAYLRSLELDPECELAKRELEYIARALNERNDQKSLPWFMHCVQHPPADPTTNQLLGLVDGLESVPGPQTIGAENYATVSAAFLTRGWAGFEEALDAIVPRTRSDYSSIKRELLREPIFNPKVHSRMARVFLKKLTVEQALEEATQESEPSKPN
jgi:tetratricopeptide (TPR) repeat protein